MLKAVLFSTIVQCAFFAAAAAETTRQPVDYVSPNIGTIGQLLTATTPFVQLPFGMARVAPVTTPGIQDRYLADKIYGFSAGVVSVMVSTGETRAGSASYASDFDHDFETATPYYYAVNLDTWRAHAELTSTQHAAIYRFTFPASQQAHIELSLGKGGELTVLGSTAVQGSNRVTGTVATAVDLSQETRVYFYAQFSTPVAAYRTWSGDALTQASSQRGDDIGFVGTTSVRDRDQLEVRVGISYIGAEQARRNLQEETAGKSFETLKDANRQVWSRALGAVSTVGGTERQRTIFYTALWRSLGRMTDVTEDGRYYSGFDHQIHEADGHRFYTDDGLWDTFRSMHPLQLLLDGHRQEDMVRSYLLMYQQSGWLPSFPSPAGEQAVMIGRHAAEFILDTYAKGYRDFDAQLAYEAMRKNATQATLIPWGRGGLTPLDHVYFEKGFFPALAWGETETVAEVTPERRQAVSVSLESAYDDWSVGQFAKALGKTDDAAYFGRLAQNYKNLWNPAIGFMAPRSADGNWVAHFDPKLGGGQGGRDYTTEINSWVYSYSVQHDPQGLIELMGGRDKFNERLDQLFREQYGSSKFSFLGQFPDATGLVGLYAQGNEPSFHIPYLYDFSGEPWKAQKRVRQMMEVWYGDGPLGIPGDDDGGETSSWYVLSALGFYPVCPGNPVYEIGSPIFSRSTIRMGNGKTFTIVADSVSSQNKYIQSATLNGRTWSKPWFAHSDIADGGELVLHMGDHPNPDWGSRAEDAPPSMSPIPTLNR
jgi:predicted alpha-1,2-mannosidase